MGTLFTILTTSLRMIVRPSSTVDTILKRKPKSYEGVILAVINLGLIYIFLKRGVDLRRSSDFGLVTAALFNIVYIVILLRSRTASPVKHAHLYAMFLLLIAAHLYVFLTRTGTPVAYLAAIAIGLWYIGVLDRFWFFKRENGVYKFRWDVFERIKPRSKRKK